MRDTGIDGPIGIVLLITGGLILWAAGSWIYFRQVSLAYAILIGLVAAAIAWFLFVAAWKRLVAWAAWLDEQKKKWDKSQEQVKSTDESVRK